MEDGQLSKMKKENLHLVISSSKDFWIKGKTNLLLGKFCINQNISKEEYQFISPVYSNSDFKQLNKEINESIFSLEDFYKEVISKFLNDYHRLSNSNSYWNIITLPWLRLYLIHCLTILKKVDFLFFKYDITSVTLIQKSIIESPIDYLDFQVQVSDLEWNEFFISKIISIFLQQKKIGTKIYYVNKIKQTKSLNINKLAQYNNFRNFKDIFRNTVFKLLDKMPINNNGPMIVASFLPFYNDLIFKLLNRQTPIQWKMYNEPVIQNLTNICRDSKETNFNSIDNEKLEYRIINETIFNLIPMSYIENFNFYKSHSYKLNWPTNPSFIFTSNSHITDDVFKVWVAEIKNRKNIKYIIGQHGNGYGTHYYPWTFQPVDIILSDLFFSWGWEGGMNVISGFILKRRKIHNYKKREKNILFVTNSLDHRTPLSHFLYDYNDTLLESHISFLKLIRTDLYEKTMIRLRHKNTNKFGGEEDRYFSEFQNIKIEFGEIPIKRLEKKFKLIVYAYDSTGILESLSEDKPFVAILSDYEINLLLDETYSYYKKLIDANIIFTDIILAAKHVNSIIEDVDNWWNAKTVVEAKNIFKEKYLRSVDRPAIKLNKIIKKYI